MTIYSGLDALHEYILLYYSRLNIIITEINEIADVKLMKLLSAEPDILLKRWAEVKPIEAQEITIKFARLYVHT